MREMRASELMTPDPITVSADTSISDAARELREHDIGILPVVENMQSKRLVGVITDRDIVVRCSAEGHSPDDCTVGQHMTREVRSARAGDDLALVMGLMREAQVRRIPVTDQSQRIIGVIAQADLAVDAVREDAASRLDIAYTLERVSKPAHPERKSMH